MGKKGVYYDLTRSRNKADMLKKNPTNLIVTMAEAKLLHGTDDSGDGTGLQGHYQVRDSALGEGWCVLRHELRSPEAYFQAATCHDGGFKEDMETFCYYHPDILDNKNSGSSGLPIQYTLNQAYDMAFKSLSSHDTEYLGKSIRWYSGDRYARQHGECRRVTRFPTVLGPSR
ncbi:hypothetical protein [Stenotrophomonas phage CM2]